MSQKVNDPSTEKLNKLIHQRNRMVVQSPYTDNNLDVIRVEEWNKQAALFVGTLFDTFLYKTSKSEIEKVLIQDISEKRSKKTLPSFRERAPQMEKEIEEALQKIKKARGGEFFDASTQQRYDRELREDVRKTMNGSISR